MSLERYNPITKDGGYQHEEIVFISIQTNIFTSPLDIKFKASRFCYWTIKWERFKVTICCIRKYPYLAHRKFQLRFLHNILVLQNSPTPPPRKFHSLLWKDRVWIAFKNCTLYIKYFLKIITYSKVLQTLTKTCSHSARFLLHWPIWSMITIYNIDRTMHVLWLVKNPCFFRPKNTERECFIVFHHITSIS